MTKHWLRILALTLLILLLLRMASLAEGATLRPDTRWPLWGCVELGEARMVVSLTGEHHTICASPKFFEDLNALIPCESGVGVEWEGHVTKEPNGTVSVGRPQVNSIHFRRMLEKGLEPGSERDIWQIAYEVWKEQGTSPWSCAK